jgi:hypothetical protein
VKLRAGIVIPVILMFVIGLCSPDVLAEDDNIETFDDRPLVRPYISIPSTKFVLSHYDNHGYNPKGITYKPNNYIDFGMSASYRMFGISVGTATAGFKKSTKDRDDYGKSESRNIQLSYYGRKISGDFFYQKYKGFYLANSSWYGYETGDSNMKRPDISLRNMSFNAFYAFADGFSLPSSMDNNERQKKSKGSFLMMLSAGDLTINAARPLIPASEADSFGGYAGFTRGHYRSAGVSAGYAYNMIIGNFYITPVLFVGAGIMQKTEHANEGRSRRYGSFNKLNGRIAAGYNGDSFVTGIRASNDTVSTRNWIAGHGNKVSFQVILVEWYCGNRF